MTAVQTRIFELMSTVTFHDMSLSELDAFTPKLATAVRDVVADHPAIVAFLVELDVSTAEVNFGLRFSAVDPAFAEDMAYEVLDEAVNRAQADGSKRIEAEREESVLVVAQ